MGWRTVACPQCGEQFSFPIITQKYLGGGFSIYPLGMIKCPRCGYEGSSLRFKHTKKGAQQSEAVPKEGEKQKPTDLDDKKLDDSRYELA